MKVIISHDVDHITAWEHKHDLILPKHIIRNCIEYGLRKISSTEMIRRVKDIVKNRWQNLEALMEFDKYYHVPATFFWGVANGRGLRYGLNDAAFWMGKVKADGFDIGVHGIAFETFDNVKKERETFAEISRLDTFGIRMHYLKKGRYTLSFLDRAGYAFDSSVYEIGNPFRVGRMWEFPLHIMDGYVFCCKAKWQNQSLEQARDATKRRIETVHERGIDYLTILFHDRYFSDGFCSWKTWYMWLIDYLRSNSCEFVSYQKAMSEMEVVRER